MRITYNGPIDAVEIAATGQVVERGDTVEVSDDLAASLIEQSSWDASTKDVVAYVGKNLERAAAMLRAELDGARRKAVVAPLEKLLGVEEPTPLPDPAPEAAPAADTTPDQKDGA